MKGHSFPSLTKMKTYCDCQLSRIERSIEELQDFVEENRQTISDLCNTIRGLEERVKILEEENNMKYKYN